MTGAAVPVMILNWNGWADTSACLDSLRVCPDVENVWLVDNGSSVDRTAEVRDRYPEVRIVRWPENYGFAGGYGRALRLAASEGAEFAYLLNNDCVARPGFLDAVAALARADATLAAVGSTMLYIEDPTFAIFDGSYHAFGTRRFVPYDNRMVEEVNGAGMLVRLSAMEEHGYFDERFFCYGEETEWCYRVRRRGGSIAVSGRSTVLHRRAGSDRGDNALYYRIRNRFLLLEPLRSARRQVWTIRYAAEAAAEAVHAHGRQRAAIAAGVGDALLGRFGPRQERRFAFLEILLVFWARILRLPMPIPGNHD
jgi:GT2 family glycosyltransferase